MWCWRRIKKDHVQNEEGLNTIIIIIFINCNWVVARWQWLFYMYTKYEMVTNKFNSGGLHENQGGKECCI